MCGRSRSGGSEGVDVVNRVRIFCAVSLLAMVVAVSGLAGGAVAGAFSSGSGAPIVVGVICTCGGPFGTEIIADVDAYKAWVDTVNKSGGLDGHPVKIIYENTTATPGKGSAEIKTLLSDHIDALFSFSLTNFTWAKTVQASGIPVVGGGVASTTYEEYSDWYPSGQTQNSAVYAVVQTIKEARAKKFAYFYCTDSAICSHIIPTIKADGAKAGDPMVYDVSVAPTAPNYDAQCLAAKQSGATGLYIGDGGAVVTAIAKSCHTQGYYPVYFTEGGGFSLSEETAPGLKTDSWAEYTNVPFFSNNPQVKKMNAAMTKYFPGVRAEKTAWPGYATTMWASGLLLATAVKHSGMTASTTPSPKLIVKGLDSLKNDTLDGTSPPLTFKAGQKHQVDCWFVGRIVHGKATVANSGKAYCE